MMPRIVTGAHLTLYVNSRAYSQVESLDWSLETPRRTIHVVDTLEPAELAPLGHRVTGTLSIYRVHLDGGPEAAGLNATLQDLHREKYFAFLVVDRLTDTVVFRADRCSVISQRWSAPARGLVRGQITFEARLGGNETSPSQF